MSFSLKPGLAVGQMRAISKLSLNPLFHELFSETEDCREEVEKLRGWSLNPLFHELFSETNFLRFCGGCDK